MHTRLLTRAPIAGTRQRVRRALQRRQHAARRMDAGVAGARTGGAGAASRSARHLPPGDCRRSTRLAAHRRRGAVHGGHAGRPGSGSGAGVRGPSAQSLVQPLSVERPRRVPDGIGPARRGPRLPPRSRTRTSWRCRDAPPSRQVVGHPRRRGAQPGGGRARPCGRCRRDAPSRPARRAAGGHRAALAQRNRAPGGGAPATGPGRGTGVDQHRRRHAQNTT